MVPGEEPDAWEAHRAAVVEDLKPMGAIELALAEQVAIKLWRLGRVFLFGANLIGNEQDPEELVHAHEMSHQPSFDEPACTDIPTRRAVQSSKEALGRAEEALATQETALRQLKSLAAMADKDVIDDWSIFEPLKHALRLGVKETSGIFKNDEKPFMARHIHAMIRMRGSVDETTTAIVTHWRDVKIPELKKAAANAGRNVKALGSRYRSVVERLRRARVIPRDIDLANIQRYESQLERGLHKAIERLQMSVTPSEGTTFSVRRIPVRNHRFSVRWYPTVQC